MKDIDKPIDMTSKYLYGANERLERISEKLDILISLLVPAIPVPEPEAPKPAKRKA